MTRHVLITLVALCGLVLPAHAQQYPDSVMSTLRFRPAAGPNNFILVAAARVPEHLSYSVGLWAEAAGPVLRQKGAECTVKNGPCDDELRGNELNSIPFAAYGHVSASLALFDRAQLALDLPIGGNASQTFYSTYKDSTGSHQLSDQPEQGFAIADPRFLARVHIWSKADGLLSVGAAAYTTVPLARVTAKDQYAGEQTVQTGGYLIGELNVSIFRFGVNAGAMYRPKARYLTARTGTELTYGVAAQLVPSPKVALTLELDGGLTVVGQGKNPAELLLGMSVGQWDWRFHIGGSAGLSNAVGTPDGRGFIALMYAPSEHDVDHDGIDDRDDACVNVPEDRDGFEDSDGCPEADNDKDGLPDTGDQCPDEAEDFDNFDDEDGCPDPDNDGDGVEDGYDSCPLEPEDVDGDRDTDGCPEDDADRDGVPDALDACPREPEDTDGLGDEDGCPEADFDRDGIDDELDSCPEDPELMNGIEDEDGCPEDDQDGDAIPDTRDRCPTKAETLNGLEDYDGCPDGVARLGLEQNRLIPTAPLLFSSTSELEQPRTFTTLDVAITFIDRHHKSGKIAVSVHAPASDRQAMTRGEAVRRYLVEKGLAAERVFVEHVAADSNHVELELVGENAEPRKAPRPVPATPEAR